MGSSFSAETEFGGSVGKVNDMRINCPVVAANAEGHELLTFPQQETRPSAQWLLELEVDGTIRHSSSHPSSATDGGARPLVGSNFFDLEKVLGDLAELKKDFFGFVKSTKNRETAMLRTGSAASDRDAVIVLTRSFDTYPTRKEIVLMEIRS